MKSITVHKYSDSHQFYIDKKLARDISLAMKKFNDYNENNYLVCEGLHIVDPSTIIDFNEDIYNNIHEQYYKYYQENNNIKIIIYSNGNYSHYWCIVNLRFINVYYYIYNNDANIILKKMKIPNIRECKLSDGSIISYVEPSILLL